MARWGWQSIFSPLGEVLGGRGTSLDMSAEFLFSPLYPKHDRSGPYGRCVLILSDSIVYLEK